MDLAQAPPLTPGVPVSSTLNPANETDLYRFSATAGTKVYFDYISSGSLPNARWRCVDPYGANVMSTFLGDAGPMVLQITSPGPNAVIDASQLVLQGRTAPGATVNVKVVAVPPTAPGRLAVAQAVTDQTLQADANGNFSLNFGPQRYAPGTRFEVQLIAKHGALAAAEQRLTLFQRQG